MPQTAFARTVTTENHRERCQPNVARIPPGFEILNSGFGQHSCFLVFANIVLNDILYQRLGQLGLGGLAGGQALAQLKAQAAQLGYAGDDAELFGEGWEHKLAKIKAKRTRRPPHSVVIEPSPNLGSVLLRVVGSIRN